MAGCCENRNEHSGSINQGEINSLTVQQDATYSVYYTGLSKKMDGI